MTGYKELYNYRVRMNRETKQMNKQVKQLKRWRIVLVLALVMITLGNGFLLSGMRDLKKSHIKSLQDMNTAYQNLLHDYENASADSYACLKELRTQQTETPGHID